MSTGYYHTIFQFGRDGHALIAVDCCGVVDMVGKDYGKGLLYPDDEGFTEMVRENLEICAQEEPKTFMRIYKKIQFNKEMIEEIRQKYKNMYDEKNPFVV